MEQIILNKDDERVITDMSDKINHFDRFDITIVNVEGEAELHHILNKGHKVIKSPLKLNEYKIQMTDDLYKVKCLSNKCVISFKIKK